MRYFLLAAKTKRKFFKLNFLCIINPIPKKIFMETGMRHILTLTIPGTKWCLIGTNLGISNPSIFDLFKMI